MRVAARMKAPSGRGRELTLALFPRQQRATKIRRFFNLDKTDDVRKFVIRREVTSKTEGAKPYTKAYVHFRPLLSAT